MSGCHSIKKRTANIKLIVFDIDGVLTDGRIYIDSEGKEIKSVYLRDIDSVFALQRRGYLIAAITGEDTPMSKYFLHRFNWDFFYDGCKNKLEKMLEIESKLALESSQVCYIGDGRYDVESIKHAGLGVCPQDGCMDAKEVADIVLDSKGGYGCVEELEHIFNI